MPEQLKQPFVEPTLREEASLADVTLNSDGTPTLQDEQGENLEQQGENL